MQETSKITTTEIKRIDRFFKISIFAKGLTSILEIMAGVAIFFVPLSHVADKLAYYAQGELTEDPNDFIGLHLMQTAHDLSVTGSTFLAFYLLSRGVVKLGLVIALLRRYLWAYPLSIAIIGLAMVYQLFLIVTTHSTIQIILTILDIIVLWFIWKEYKVLLTHPNKIPDNRILP